MKELYITALELPGNIQKPFYELQTQLFRQFHMPSARVFPPIIPLTLGKLTGELSSLIKETIKKVNFFSASPAIQQHEGIYFSPLEIEPLSDLAYPLPAGETTHVKIFPPQGPAIFLAAGEEKSTYGVTDKLRFKTAVVRWKKMYVTELFIRVKEKKQWWEEIYWEYTQYHKISCGPE